MNRSTQRILTTHVGSLPRPRDLLQMTLARDRGEPCDERAYEARLGQAVAEVVDTQARVGLDVIDDGEFGKASFMHYVNRRLSGFEPGSARARRIRSPTRASSRLFPSTTRRSGWVRPARRPRRRT
jgi:5-methyltetrahydropteroyltriglutamate--homocysteine methyltransferase